MICKSTDTKNDASPAPSEGAIGLSAGHHSRRFGPWSTSHRQAGVGDATTASYAEETLSESTETIIASADHHLATMMNMNPEDLRAAFHEQRQRKRDQLQQAHKVAEVISKRDFGSDKIFRTNDQSSIFPSGLGYGLLLGGAAFAAISIPGRMLARGALGRFMGHRAAYIGMRAVALLTAGTVGYRYVHRNQTLEGLKILGTHLSPTEPSANADALCQHPLITQAIAEQRKHNGLQHYWYGRSWQSSSSQSSWWLNDSHILMEFQNVLANCEKRSANLKETTKVA